MKFNFITLFKNLIKPYFDDSILKRALDKNLFEVDFINPRDFSKDKHKKVDDYMVGGGAGLLMGIEPLSDAILNIKNKNPNTHIIYLTPVGKKFTQKDAKRLSKKDNITFICGRYEGIDERVIEKYVNEVFCVGDFIMTGGELGALCMCDAICRNIDGVLGNADSLLIESFENSLLEAPSFTKPNIFENLSVPSEFLKGNHGKISALKNQMARLKTNYFRPDLKDNHEK
ncbi:tRNA (guanosine(37)-N1)-methyltransferase TrmD [Campylobacter ureolyticus]|uniref:tRNA (guanine-N(1)-)-methyltransferase n=1 Tax=Campylobacter ureolyticus TaxID=827 RepID=A0A9Q4KM29_9BACT|nr:tRNA (guanosine(37)-N1)-methyltransferase TrmD [Campylobacter ureolyticus]MCZ6160139.1 tRNA (guanosine(37)-N1)-methyltransferase TrmD [Campylobacter ureolyticus]MCZ6163944.1 tRNA (guanosine(37)-N1)-methyltransferase TrmD [Campylobacter ureolyticus]MCZ6165913.1 tRNA (guanosine(37)-N1)-methyltransferase TrmD [Campylobacter ureolyticus]MCZ6167397.1 tRNA (guanosine(37)-N1)-methyltransferase TrmD [Campylobacter ureolyticus]